MTSKDIITRYGVSHAAVTRWASENGVAAAGEGNRKTYQWTEEDCRRFLERKRPGWKKGRPRKASD